MMNLQIKNGTSIVKFRKKTLNQGETSIDKALDWYLKNDLTYTPQSIGYTLGIENESGETFDEIAVFYQLNNGVISHESQYNILNSSYHTFDLGVCEQLQSYTFGAYIGNKMVVNSGNITPSETQALSPNYAGFTIYA